MSHKNVFCSEEKQKDIGHFFVVVFLAKKDFDIYLHLFFEVLKQNKTLNL